MSHPCRNYCSQWTGEQCKGCMISDEAELQDPPAVEYCPHGYDTACLICGFGTKDGERVWHNKPPAAPRPNESDFAVGDLVVFDDQESPLHPTFKSIFLIDGVYTATVDLNFAGTVNLPKRMMRLATLAEKAAGHRIDEVELITQTNVVCTEAEPLDLFNSKHCSPRNYNNDSALRVSEIKASVDCSKLALTNFTLSEKNSRLKTNNHALKAALAVAIVVGVVGWML